MGEVGEHAADIGDDVGIGHARRAVEMAARQAFEQRPQRVIP
jgi:hypothetical protein